MKKILLVGLVLLDLVAVEIIPNWYPPKNSIISYGDGKSFKEAKNNAFIKLKRMDDNLSNLNISDVEVVKQEVLEDQYYLKIKYINQSLIDQLKIYISQLPIQPDIETNQYLINTPLLKDLNNSLGYFPHIELDGQNLYLNEKKFLIKDDEFASLLSELHSDDILLDLKNNLCETEKYFIKLSPTIDGYVTLVQISNNTNVDVLFSNKSLNKDKFTIFPNFKLSDGLESVLPKDKDVSQTLTMAIICDKQKDFSDFNNMFLSFSVKKYMLSNLIDEIEDCHYTSILTTITK